MKKIIFLDVDGVLNIFSESYMTNNVEYDTRFNFSITRLEFHLVKRLEYIIKNTDAYIVVCSGWSVDELKMVLEDCDFKYLSRIIDEIDPTDRVKSILNYVKEHNITDYIVLDDKIDYELLHKYLPNEIDRIPFIGTRVNYREGLTDDNALYAINWLNKIGTLAKFK